MIAPTRAIVLALAGLFSAYHLVLAVYSIGTPSSPWPVFAAMILYAVVSVMSLWPRSPLTMPVWLAALNVAVSIVMSILVFSQLDGRIANGYATWSVAAVGTLMTITAVRHRAVFAWLGVIGLAVCVVVWANPLALTTTGVIGSAVWVAVAHALSRALAQASRDTQLFARAELDAAAWRATQEAQLTEGRYRLDNMNRVAGPMLHRIVDLGGDISAEEREECLHLEGAIRDEIRGRYLLNEDVRTEVLAARRRGIEVTLLDDGGLDDLSERARDRIQSRIARTISRSRSDRLIVRTGVDSSTAAVTVVGLKVGDDPGASVLGAGGDDDEVAEWLEIPKEASPG
ncbi:hypothetical protein [Subtercola boreus]|uniref:Uncharacterized protein n=1 Tax=Subtercola boreus TaxID=120213 RepID=A0A3E0WES8_9MICO|nr:hypothetical protein [Subtercola boreus]RFA22614.1 hypothetical protein B7R24_03085 [Subtercola boreus]RFA22970.1 hypothetical protein B7R23_03080 [Subtercola boreus]RFA28721.1 hypothetical protein B7R25_03095 [Subtercola boreus]